MKYQEKIYQEKQNKKTCTLSGMSLLQMDRPLHGFMLGDSQHVCGRKKQQKKHNSSTNALCMTPSRSLSTNTSPFENTKWANEMTAGKKKRKKCHKRGYVHVWARKKSFLHLILDQNYRNAEPLHRWHHISSPWFFLNRPVSMESRGELVSKEDLICRWGCFPLCC